MGYLIVGQRIDPDDWNLRDGNPIPAKEIVDSVLRQAGNGNVILLHDGGGDRTQTVAALPQIIDALRGKGYELVSVSDLIGKTRAEVMPLLSPQERSKLAPTDLSSRCFNGSASSSAPSSSSA